MTRITYRYMDMLVTEKKKKAPRADRRQFKRTLNTLMVNKRAIFSWKDLRAELRGVGYDVSQSALSQYLSGERSRQDEQRFFDAIARALSLTEEEKKSLVYAYAFPGGSDRPGPTEETVRRAEEAEQRIRGEEVDGGERAHRAQDNQA